MANDFKVYDLYATTLNVSGRPLVNGTGIVLSGEATTLAYVTDISGNLQNQLNNTVLITGNQIISGIKTFSDPTIFNSTSIVAPNQTISNSSSLLTKSLGDSLYGINYFSMTTGLSSGVDNDSIGQKIHSFILPSGTYEFNSYVSVSGTVSTGGQGLKFYFYPDTTYNFYGEATRNVSTSFATPQSMIVYSNNSNLPFLLSTTTNSLINYCNINGVLIINQTTEVSIYIAQALQIIDQPVYLLEGSYLKARKIN